MDPQKPILHDPGQTSEPTPNTQQQAANVIRGQVEQVYQAGQQQNPYDRTHQENFDWRKYHSAWQNYYQQYYQRYYWQQLHASRQKQAAQSAQEASKPADEPQAIVPNNQVITGEDATVAQPTRVAALKKDLTNKVKNRAGKVRRSKHFIPILSALVVGLAFIFLQFNTLFIAQVKAYVSPGALSNDAVSIDPSTNVNVGPEPRLIIPKINVDVPVDYSVTGLDDTQIQDSLRDGATHYNLPGASAVPGQYGNTVILGHSSNDIFHEGAYKFVFVLLDRLDVGDVFYLHYNGTRYIYKITKKQVINPTQVSALQIGNAQPMATLVTCTPPGTALNRLLIFGQQISPDPTGDKTAQTPTTPSTGSTSTTIPGNAPTLLEQIWNFFF